MWPIIISEGLVAARRALTVLNVADTLLGTDEDSRDETLRHISIEDDDIYFYLLAKGLFRYMSACTGYPEPDNKKLFQIVDGVLISNVYASAAPDTDNKTAAFCTAFAHELTFHGDDYIDKIRETIDAMREKQEIPWLVESITDDKPFITALGKHLEELQYKKENVKQIVDAFSKGAFKTPKLQNYIAGIGDGYLALAESWLSLIYSSLSAGRYANSLIYTTTRTGGLCFNSYLLPLWRPNTLSQMGKRPTFAERSITNGDVQAAEHRQMTDRGYTKSDITKTWVPSQNVPKPPASDISGAERLAEAYLMNKALGGLSKLRFTKRLSALESGVKALGNTTKLLE